MSDVEGGVHLPNSNGRDLFKLFGSSFCPNQRESGVQLTEKQVVLLMHDICDVNLAASLHIICLGGPNKYITLFFQALATDCASLLLRGVTILKLV